MTPNGRIATIVFSIIALVLITEVFLQQYVPIQFLSLLYFVLFTVFIAAIYICVKGKQWLALSLGVASGVLCVSMMLNNWSESIFLGKPIGSIYRAEAPGYIELIVYEKGRCTVGYGGITGLSKIGFNTYELKQDTIYVSAKELNCEELTNAAVVIHSHQYFLKQLK
ncbi:MAG: hypothetical protein V4613_00285 [Bacteroidota bacterium]